MGRMIQVVLFFLQILPDDVDFHKRDAMVEVMDFLQSCSTGQGRWVALHDMGIYNREVWQIQGPDLDTTYTSCFRT